MRAMYSQVSINVRESSMIYCVQVIQKINDEKQLNIALFAVK
jgi:hypothetical protein